LIEPKHRRPHALECALRALVRVRCHAATSAPGVRAPTTRRTARTTTPSSHAPPLDALCGEARAAPRATYRSYRGRAPLAPRAYLPTVRLRRDRSPRVPSLLRRGEVLPSTARSPGYKTTFPSPRARELVRHPPLELSCGAPPSGPPPSGQSSSTPPHVVPSASCVACGRSRAAASPEASSRRPPSPHADAPPTPTSATIRSLVSPHTSTTSSPADPGHRIAGIPARPPPCTPLWTQLLRLHSF
jgi:hypothetical protein